MQWIFSYSGKDYCHVFVPCCASILNDTWKTELTRNHFTKHIRGLKALNSFDKFFKSWLLYKEIYIKVFD